MTASPKQIVVLRFGMALIPSQTYKCEELPTDKDFMIVHLSEYTSVKVNKDKLNFN